MRKILLKAVTTFASALGLTDPRLYQFFQGGTTSSGEAVTANTALQLDAVYSCVKLVAQTIATLPLFLYRRDDTGRGILARDHPLFALLHDRPNSDMTAVSFWECMVSGLLLWGNAYAVIERRADGTAIAMTPLLPDRLTVRREPSGSLIYRYQSVTGPEEYTEDNIFHVKGFSLDGMVGLSPIAVARETLGIAIAAEKSSASFYRNSMRPSVVWTAPGYLHENQRTRAKQIIEEFSGSINVGRTPLIEGGWKLDVLSINPQDAQLLAVRGYSVEQICRIFGVPPVMIGHTQAATAWGSGLEQMGQWFLTYNLRPYLRGIEQEIHRSLLTVMQRQQLYAEFNADALLRTDAAARANMMQTYANNGLRTRNELRELDNMAPMPGGDTLTVHSALIPIDDLGKIATVPREKDISQGLPLPNEPQNQAPPGKPAGKPVPMAT